MKAKLNLTPQLKLSISCIILIALIFEKYFDSNPLDFSYQIAISIVGYLLVSHDVISSALITLFKQKRMSEQFLMMIATFGAFSLGDLPEALAVMIFYKIGEVFEEYASGRAHNEITSLIKLKPSTVRLINEDGTESIVKPKEVKIGDTIKVLAGEVIAIDGYLIEESAAIDTAALTGESEPKLYIKGQSVPSGCINTGNVITLSVNTLSRNSSITRLLNLIEDAAANKSRPEALIRRFAVWYTPIVVSCACLLACVPIVLSDAHFSDWIERALVFLVVSCPCALVLSVPLSFFGGMGAISKIGVIVKGSIHIETLSKIKTIAFDKTGTLTYGDFKVVNVVTEGCTEDTLLKYALAIEENSTHPIAQSIIKYAKDKGIEPHDVSDIKEIAGRGLEGSIDNTTVRVGKESYVNEFVENYNFPVKEDTTKVFVSVGSKCLGMIELFDELKPSASNLIEYLNANSISSVLISGDRDAVATSIADKLKITKVFSEQSPEDKLNNFSQIQKKQGPAAFVGDGLNDAPVLSRSDVGIAMGDIGSAAAIEAADVVVMKDDLKSIAKTIDIAKKTYKLAISNFILVMGIKILILVLGALGFANIWLAIFGDVGVLILAVLNAMRSLKFK